MISLKRRQRVLDENPFTADETFRMAIAMAKR